MKAFWNMLKGIKISLATVLIIFFITSTIVMTGMVYTMHTMNEELALLNSRVNIAKDTIAAYELETDELMERVAELKEDAANAQALAIDHYNENELLRSLLKDREARLEVARDSVNIQRKSIERQNEMLDLYANKKEEKKGWFK